MEKDIKHWCDNQLYYTMSTKKTVYLALPDTTFSSPFVISLLGTVNKVIAENKYHLVIVPGGSRHPLIAHYNTLGFDPKRGIDQKPFNGDEFDYWINVSATTIFTTEQFIKLVESLEEHPVVAGICRMENLESCSYIDAPTGFAKIAELEEWKKENPDTKYKSVKHSELKFFGVRREVLDAMKYPHFECDAVLSQGADGEVVRDLLSHDMAFCRNIKMAGYDILVNTELLIGNEVKIIV
jgi:hypothetical protein